MSPRGNEGDTEIQAKTLITHYGVYFFDPPFFVFFLFFSGGMGYDKRKMRKMRRNARRYTHTMEMQRCKDAKNCGSFAF